MASITRSRCSNGIWSITKRSPATSRSARRAEIAVAHEREPSRAHGSLYQPPALGCYAEPRILISPDLEKRMPNLAAGQERHAGELTCGGVSKRRTVVVVTNTAPKLISTRLRSQPPPQPRHLTSE
jgi:hypothetical protein